MKIRMVNPEVPLLVVEGEQVGLIGQVCEDDRLKRLRSVVAAVYCELKKLSLVPGCSSNVLTMG